MKLLLCFDFKMFSAGKRDPNSGGDGKRERGKFQPVKPHEVVALFNDQETVDAVTAAPPIVRLFLEEAGFGLQVAPPEEAERPPALEVLGMRRKISDQLTMALSNRALKRALQRAAEVSDFDIAAFIASVVSSNPDKKSLAIRVSDEFVVEEIPHALVEDVSQANECMADQGTTDDEAGPKVTLRRPSELRGKGLKSRLRPHYS